MDAATPEEVFSYCLENPDNLSQEQLLAKFPLHREELQPLLLLHRRLAESLPQQLPAPAHDVIKQRLMQAAEARQPRIAPLKPARRQSERRPMWPRRIAWATATVGVLVGLVWLLAARSLPDSPLYGIKLATEDLLVNASGEAASRARTHIGLANTRLLDLRMMNDAGKLGQAEASFSNYGTHLSSGAGTWRTLSGNEHIDLDKFLYVSSVAGRRTFEGFDSAVRSLPAPVQKTITRTLADLGTLTDETTQKLRAAGVDLDQTLREAGGELASLLGPEVVPSPLPVPTPTSIAIAIASTATVATPLAADTPAIGPVVIASASPGAEATRLAVLYAAQTVVAEGGSVETPVVAAAETVMAGVPGTPLAQAQQTVMSARPTALPTPSPAPP